MEKDVKGGEASHPRPYGEILNDLMKDLTISLLKWRRNESYECGVSVSSVLSP